MMALTGLISCSNEEPSVISLEQEPEQRTSLPVLRTPAQAVAIAEMAVQSEEAVSRSQRTVSGVSAVTPIVNHSSRSESDTLLYVVQYDNNNGFAVISAPVNVEPLIALIDDGSYNSTEILTNEPFQMTMEAAEHYVANQSRSSILRPDPIEPIHPYPFEPAPKPFYSDTIKPTPKTVPSVTVKWGQGWPQSMYAPNHIAGCAPVAIAQILSVFETPRMITYSFPELNRVAEFLNWSEIKTHIGGYIGDNPSNSYIESHLNHCNASSAVHNSIGALVRQLGLEVKAKYKENTTSTEYREAFNILKKYLSNKSFIEGSLLSSLFRNLVDDDTPIAYVRGAHKDADNNKHGHGWVADGTWSIGTRIYDYAYNYTTGLYDIVNVTGSNSTYIHYNWGWDGSGNGYFSTGVYSPSEPFELDNPYDGVYNDYSFSYDIKYLYIY